MSKFIHVYFISTPWHVTRENDCIRLGRSLLKDIVLSSDMNGVNADGSPLKKRKVWIAVCH